LLEVGPAIADYQTFTGRQFPVVVLEPAAPNPRRHVAQVELPEAL
jgi:hypothetical protein